MKQEFLVHDMETMAGMLRWLARRLKLSVNALAGAGGAPNNSLTSFATGSKPSNDLNCGPVLKVLKAVNYGFITRPKHQLQGVTLQLEGTHPVLLVGLEGRPLEFWWDDLQDIPVLLRTLAMTQGLSITTLAKNAGLKSLSLVSRATGNSGSADLRLMNLFHLIDYCGFETVCSPVHATRREARLTLAAATGMTPIRR